MSLFKILFNNVAISSIINLLKTDLRLVDERCVTSFHRNLQGYIIDKYFNYFLIVWLCGVGLELHHCLYPVMS